MEHVYASGEMCVYVYICVYIYSMNIQSFNKLSISTLNFI